MEKVPGLVVVGNGEGMLMMVGKTRRKRNTVFNELHITSKAFCSMFHFRKEYLSAPEWDVFIWIHLHHNTWIQAFSLEAVGIFSKMFCPTDWLSRLPSFERQYINAVQVLQIQPRNQSIEKH